VKGTDRLVDFDVHGRVLLKWMIVRTGFKCSKIESVATTCERSDGYYIVSVLLSFSLSVNYYVVTAKRATI
jgi:hypothetical protein